MIKQNIKYLLNLLKTKQISAVELTKHYLEKAKSKNKELNTYITITEEMALEQAKKVDAQKNFDGLAGIPMAHKDIFCTKGVRTSCGSHMLDNFISPYDATIVSKLADAGAVMLGKTNLDEFAMGSSNKTSFYGKVLNPLDISRIPGGSSGGSAASVIADMAVFATGSDTGGSIRQPSSYCGITGIKPTYGKISRFGMVAFASSLDTAGIMARSAEDIAYAMTYCVGFDKNDSTSSQRASEDYIVALGRRKDLSGVRVGIIKDLEKFSNFGTSLYQDFVEEMKNLGAILVEIDISFWKHSPLLYKILAYSEATSNLSRFDGIRYGFSGELGQGFISKNRSIGFGTEVKRRLLIGSNMLLEANYERYYKESLKLRRLIYNKMQDVFSKVDILLTPTTPTIAPKFDNSNFSEEFTEDVLVMTANMSGVPALSLPMGKVDEMPVGMQVLANHHQESLMLQLAHLYQQKTSWHL